MWLIRLISTAGFRELNNDKMPCKRIELLDWLKLLKDRVQPQPKQEWNEEDAKISNAIYESIDFLCLKSFGFSEDEVCDWLKSIKPNHWKPSEYDISLLEEIAKNIRNNVRPFCSEVSSLEDLINNLKKL